VASRNGRMIKMSWTICSCVMMDESFHGIDKQ
jgi:hypothetical protein